MDYTNLEKSLKEKHGTSNNEYYGFKGFDKDLKCKGFQFEVGKSFSKPEKENPIMCSEDGFHFCDQIQQVFNHYSNDGKNRFCLIKVTGNFSKQYDKSITTSMVIVEEITQEMYDLTIEGNICLETVKSIQQRYPTLHVGGSTALFLHGIKLKRLGHSKGSDIDMVCPYFILFESDEDHDVEYNGARASANDFDETFIYDGVKVDIRIDNKQRYEIINYKGFNYKVSLLETIMEAKIRYALNGQQKHKNDVYEIMGKKQNKK